MNDLDHPFNEVLKQADSVIKQGGHVFQKFTCENCGSRQTMGKADTFYKTGRCEECGHVTIIVERGCNYMAYFGPLSADQLSDA